MTERDEGNESFMTQLIDKVSSLLEKPSAIENVNKSVKQLLIKSKGPVLSILSSFSKPLSSTDDKQNTPSSVKNNGKWGAKKRISKGKKPDYS